MGVELPSASLLCLGTLGRGLLLWDPGLWASGRSRGGLSTEDRAGLGGADCPGHPHPPPAPQPVPLWAADPLLTATPLPVGTAASGSGLALRHPPQQPHCSPVLQMKNKMMFSVGSTALNLPVIKSS